MRSRCSYYLLSLVVSAGLSLDAAYTDRDGIPASLLQPCLDDMFHEQHGVRAAREKTLLGRLGIIGEEGGAGREVGWGGREGEMLLGWLGIIGEEGVEGAEREGWGGEGERGKCCWDGSGS